MAFIDLRPDTTADTLLDFVPELHCEGRKHGGRIHGTSDESMLWYVKLHWCEGSPTRGAIRVRCNGYVEYVKVTEYWRCSRCWKLLPADEWMQVIERAK